MLNTSIITGYRAPQIQQVDPVEQFGAGLKLKSLLAQQQAGEQAQADDQAQRQAFAQSGGDQSAYLKALASGGNYKAYQAAQKADLDRQKAQADIGHVGAQTAQANATAGKTAQETKFAAATQHAQDVVNVQSPEDAVAYIDSGIQKGIFPAAARDQMIQKSQQYPSIDAWKQASIQGAIPVLERFKVEAENSRNAATNQTSRQNNTDTNNTSRLNNQATVGATMRGQNMVDARTRESTAATNSVARDRLEFDKNKGDEKPLTDTQSKALAFGSRMREADKVLGQLATEGTETSIPGSRTPVIGGTVTALSSGNRQMLDQAKRDFMTAILRRESGAAISQGEFDTADKQYFPQIGDSASVKAQKQRNRELAIDGVLVEVPKKQRDSLQPRNASVAGDLSGHPPDIAELLKKYGK